MSKMTAKEIADGLCYFKGTEHYYAYRSPLTGRIIGYYTDGVQFVVKNCEAYWLLDAIFSYQDEKLQEEPFQAWTLTRRETPSEGGIEWDLVCEDGDYNVLVRQEIGSSTFPLNKIKFYLEATEFQEKPAQVLLLPMEH